MNTKDDLLKVSKEITVLYVEDEQMIREQYASIFSLLFKEVETAENGMDALKKYNIKHYDLVITDLTMPKMDGVTLIGKLLEINPEQHIIIMTAHNSNENLRASIDFQVDGVLLKPVKKDKLFSLLEKVCQNIISKKKEPPFLKIEERVDNLLLSRDQDLFIVVVDRLNEIAKEFGMQVKRFILDAVREHLLNFGIENEETLKIHNDVILFTTHHECLSGILETLQDFSQVHNSIEVAFHDLKVYITLSYGFIMYKKERQNSEKSHDYMYHIDKIVDKIKKNRYSTQVVTMDADLEEAKKSDALSWLGTTITALEQKKIVPFYQPTVDIETLQTTSYDIYARIKQDEKYILPMFFIDLSEKAGILEEISRAILKQGFEKLSTTKYFFHIKIGNSELRDQSFVDYLLYLSSRFDIKHDRVVLDILHYESINPTGKRIKVILKLKNLGFKIAFKGSASTNINIELMSIIQPDYVKIDQIVVQKSLLDKNIKLMLSFFLQYALKVNIKTILVNVEDEKILEKGRKLGFDYVQGYLIAKPSAVLEVL